MKKFKQILKAIKGSLKVCLTEDVILTVITFIVNVCIELIKQITFVAHSEGEFSNEVINIALTNFLTWRPIVNIALMTMIVWFVLGISKLLNNQHLGRRTLISSMFVFIISIITIAWYIIEIIYPASWFTIGFGVAIAFLMFILLFIFFSCKKINRKSTDNTIAAEPTQE